MKETEIAIGNLKHYLDNDEADVCKINCKEHKQTCQRWLEFLKFEIIGIENITTMIKIRKKAEDLKQAIKIYEDAGI